MADSVDATYKSFILEAIAEYGKTNRQGRVPMQTIVKYVKTQIGRDHFERKELMKAVDDIVQNGEAGFDQHGMFLFTETNEPRRKRAKTESVGMYDNDGDVEVVPEDKYEDIVNVDGKDSARFYDTLTPFRDQTRTYTDIATTSDSTLALGSDKHLYIRGRDMHMRATNEFQRVESHTYHTPYSDITQVFANSSTREYCFTMVEDGVTNTYAMKHGHLSRDWVKDIIDLKLFSSYSHVKLLGTSADTGSRHEALFEHGEPFARELCTNRIFVWQSPTFDRTHVFFSFDETYRRQSIQPRVNPLATCIGRNFAHFVDSTGQLWSLRTSPGDDAARGFHKQSQPENDTFHDIAHGVFGTFAIVTRRGQHYPEQILMRVVHDVATGSVVQCGPVKDTHDGRTTYLSNCKQVSVGRNFAAVLTNDNKVYVVQKATYGDTSNNTFRKIYDNYGPIIDKVSAGQYHLIALDAHGHLWGYGNNDYFQAGDTNPAREYEVVSDGDGGGGGVHGFMLRLRLQ